MSFSWRWWGVAASSHWKCTLGLPSISSLMFLSPLSTSFISFVTWNEIVTAWWWLYVFIYWVLQFYSLLPCQCFPQKNFWFMGGNLSDCSAARRNTASVGTYLPRIIVNAYSWYIQQKSNNIQFISYSYLCRNFSDFSFRKTNSTFFKINLFNWLSFTWNVHKTV